MQLPLFNTYLQTGNLHFANQGSLIIWTPEAADINQPKSIAEFQINNWFVQLHDAHALCHSMTDGVKKLTNMIIKINLII